MNEKILEAKLENLYEYIVRASHEQTWNDFYKNTLMLSGDAPKYENKFTDMYDNLKKLSEENLVRHIEDIAFHSSVFSKAILIFGDAMKDIGKLTGKDWNSNLEIVNNFIAKKFEDIVKDKYYVSERVLNENHYNFNGSPSTSNIYHRIENDSTLQKEPNPEQTTISIEALLNKKLCLN